MHNGIPTAFYMHTAYILSYIIVYSVPRCYIIWQGIPTEYSTHAWGVPLKYSKGSAKFAHRSLTNHKMERISAITGTISCFCLPNWHATDTSVAVGSSGKWIGYAITSCYNVRLCKKCRYVYTMYIYEVGRGTNLVSILSYRFQGYRPNVCT